MECVDFREPFIVLLKEAFEGQPEGQEFTWFVEGKEGIFDALDNVTPEEASRKPGGTCASISGHTLHILYLMRYGNSFIGGPKPEGDWESSWSKQAVTSQEWSEARREIAKNYEFFLNWLRTNEDWETPGMVTGVMGALPHLAYHLGAIRSLMRMIPTKS